MEIEDFTDTCTFDRANDVLLLDDMRCIIVGKSGCGKTNLMFNMILKMLDFDTLYIFGKSCYQPMYQKLKKCFDAKCSPEMTAAVLRHCKGVGHELLEDLLKASDNGGKRSLILLEKLPAPEEFDRDKKNILVLDDVMLEKQQEIEPFFTRGRHNNINMFYITQNYIEVPNHTIRENANFIIAFRQNDQNIRNLHKDHGSGMPLKEFAKFCHDSWNEREHSYLCIVPDSNFKFRRGFDEFYEPF